MGKTYIPKKYEKYIKYDEKIGYYRVSYKKRKSTFKTKEKCLDFINKVDYEEQQGIVHQKVKSEHATLEAALKDWETKYIINSNKRVSTKSRALQIIDNQIIPNIGYLQYLKITKDDVTELVNGLRNGNNKRGIKYSESTVKKAYELLKTFYKDTDYIYQIQKGVFNHKYNFSVKKNKDSAFSMEQMQKLIDATGIKSTNFEKVKRRLSPAIALLASTGLREGELLGLTWDDLIIKDNLYFLNINKSVSYQKSIDTNERKLFKYGTKTNGERTIPLNKNAILAIEYYKKINGNSEYIVANTKGQIYDSSAIRKEFTKILEDASLTNPIIDDKNKHKFSVHSLRHTFATILINEKHCNISHVTQLLGHKDIKTTTDYYVQDNPQLYLDDVLKLD